MLRTGSLLSPSRAGYIDLSGLDSLDSRRGPSASLGNISPDRRPSPRPSKSLSQTEGELTKSCICKVRSIELRMPEVEVHTRDICCSWTLGTSAEARGYLWIWQP